VKTITKSVTRSSDTPPRRVIDVASVIVAPYCELLVDHVH
jgi:hypothetical protein